MRDVATFASQPDGARRDDRNIISRLRDWPRNFSFLEICILWYCYVYLTTLILSSFASVNRFSIVLAHVIFAGVTIAFIRVRIQRPALDLSSVTIVFLCVVLFVQGFSSAPNTTDTLAYHLPRVMYWIQAKSAFQSEIFTEHDFMGAFGEYIQLHLYLIADADRLVYVSQWLAFVGAIVASVKIATQLGLPKQARAGTGLLAATVPMALVQASSTQVDLLTAFLFLSSIWFSLELKRRPSMRMICFWSIAISLGVLTKATMLIFGFVSAGMVLAAIYPLRARRTLYLCASGCTLGVLVSPFLIQNELLYHSLLGEHQTAEGVLIYTNEVFSLGSLVSNIVRNLATQVPLPFLADRIQLYITSLHMLLHIDVNDPRTTWYGEQFHVMSVLYPQEDLAANPLQLLLIVFSGLALAIRRVQRNNTIAYLYVAMTIAFCLFSAVLKWQPWHSRLLLPLFLLGTTLSCVVLASKQSWLTAAVWLSTALGILIIAFNVSRPLVSYDALYPLVKGLMVTDAVLPQSVFIKPRRDQYFNARPYWQAPYAVIAGEVASEHPTAVRLDLMDGFEYPFWVLLKEVAPGVRVLPGHNARGGIVYTSKTPRGYWLENCVEAVIARRYACYGPGGDAAPQ